MRISCRPVRITARRAAFAGQLVSVLLIALIFLHTQKTTARQGRALTAPPGFDVELVAGPPLVNRPIVADFDEQGRLYVADSSGSSERVEVQLANRPHRIVRLEDVDGDGRFDTSVVFADKMMLPEGTMWLDGSLYVAAPPSIWKLTDTDGDGVADRREEWFQGQTVTGCANDLHGPYLGLDGWIYWTKGAFAQQTYARDGAPPFVTRASHIFRRRPGGTPIDVVMTGGMDNPVDVAFTKEGERILTATFVEQPQAGKRDGLLHAVYGGVYGKPNAVVDGHKRTGDLMPVMCQLGPAVPAGLTRYASAAFGPEYRESFFAAMFNLRKVTRHVLAQSGATFSTRDSDFVVSDDRDFHPTDVIEDADGSLLIVDTGPWYKLCCPSSQIAKPNLLGAIYRVRRRGAPAIVDPRGARLTWSAMTPGSLAGLLDDPRPFVQSRVLGELGTMGARAVPALAEVIGGRGSAEARRNAVWALARIDDTAARAAVRTAIGDRDEGVRQAAAHVAGLWRDGGAVPALIAALDISGVRGARRPALQRAAAEALGRIDDVRAVPALIAAAASPVDRVLEHSLTYALIEIGDPAATSAGLDARAAGSKRAALIALDQMPDGGLGPERVVSYLEASDRLLREAAWWVAIGHPDWGGALAGVLERRLTAPPRHAADRDDLKQALARFAGHAAVQRLLADTIMTGASIDARLTALGAMAAAASTTVPVSSRLRELPPVWAGALASVMAQPDERTTRAAVAATRALPPGAGAIDDALRGVARDGRRPSEVRLEALAARRGSTPLDADTFELVRVSLGPTSPAARRGLAAAIVEKAALTRDQLSALARALSTAGPLELARMLPAFDQSAEEAVGLAMLRGLQESASRSAVRPDVLRPRLAKYPASVKQAGEDLLASVGADTRQQTDQLDAFVAAAAGGDIARGQQVFNSAKAACLSCHTIGYVGGLVGPDLTRIGQVRGDRDLVEAIVFPNASFARGYEPVSETTTSPMPPGYGSALTRQELADLVAFLRAAR